MRKNANILIICACLAGTALTAAEASARTVEAGSVWGGAALGPAFKLHTQVGGSTTYLSLYGQGEYALSSQWSVAARAGLGLADTVPLRLLVGGRYRLVGLGMALSPYAQAQLSLARLYDVIGANLNYIGARLAVGADYFLTADISAGAEFGWDAGTTRGPRPAYYETVELLLHASMRFL